MKKTLTLIIPAVFFILLFSNFLTIGFAAYISIGTYDATTGQPKEIFAAGEQVRIKANSSDKPITIVVKDPDGYVVHNEEYDGYEYDKVLSGLTTKGGWYTVEASSPIDTVRINFACTYFNVVPDVPLGTAGATTAIAFALAFYSLARRRKLKYA
jgi:hypothetical protein